MKDTAGDLVKGRDSHSRDAQEREREEENRGRGRASVPSDPPGGSVDGTLCREVGVLERRKGE